MKRWFWLALGLSLLSACDKGEATSSGAQPEVRAHVRLQTLSRHDLVENLTLFGVVVSGPEAAHASSVPFDVIVRQVFVRAGQPVAVGDPLVEVEASQDARLALRQARAAASTADEALAAVRQRLSAGMATRAEVAAAERDAETATLLVRSLAGRGVGRRRTLRAEGEGLVRTVHFGAGDLAAANASLVELALSSRREVKLGIEVEDSGRVQTGGDITVTDLALPPRQRVQGVVRTVGEAVDPTTRLVDVYAGLPAESGLLLNQRVQGLLPIHAGSVLAVPRAALVPVADGMQVYVVDDQGVAHAHRVRTGLENATEIEISGPGLAEGARVAVEGASVLTDGMQTVEDQG